MAFNAGAVEAELRLEGDQFVTVLKEAGSAADDFTESTKSAGEESEGFSGKLNLTLDVLEAFKTGLNLLGDGLEFVTGLFNRANDEFGKFESTLESLDIALSLRGLGDMSGELVKFAQSMQDTTQHSRVSTLEVAKFLSLAGVGEKDLQRFTKIVLDFSAATGIEARTAATQFARTLSGGVSRALTQYTPEVLKLTKAQREAGGAFELAGRKMKDFSEKLAGTNVALGARLANEITQAFQNIGEALDPVLDDALVVGRKMVNALATGIKENQDEIGQAFAVGASKAYDTLIRVGEALAGIDRAVRLTYGGFAVFFELVSSGFGMMVDGLLGLGQHLFDELIRKPLEGLAAVFAALDFEGVIAEKVTAALDVAGEFWKTKVDENLVQPLTKVGDGLADAAKEAGGITDEATKAGDALSTFDKVLAGVVAAMKEGAVAAKGIAAGIEQAGDNAQSGRSAADVLAARYAQMGLSAGKAAEEVQEMKKALLDAAHGTSAVTKGTAAVAGQAAVAAQSFGSWTDSIWSANAALQQTASSAAAVGSSAGGAFGTGGAGDAFGRHSGGSASFATDNAAATAATLAGLQGMANFATIGTSARSGSQYALWQGLVAKLKGQLAEESKAFASGIIDSLNQQGIFDPAARDQFIRTRMDEARRLGVVPRNG